MACRGGGASTRCAPRGKRKRGIARGKKRSCSGVPDFVLHPPDTAPVWASAPRGDDTPANLDMQQRSLRLLRRSISQGCGRRWRGCGAPKAQCTGHVTLASPPPRRGSATGPYPNPPRSPRLVEIRDDLEQRRLSKEAFYARDAWRNGPREAIVACFKRSGFRVRFSRSLVSVASAPAPPEPRLKTPRWQASQGYQLSGRSVGCWRCPTHRSWWRSKGAYLAEGADARTLANGTQRPAPVPGRGSDRLQPGRNPFARRRCARGGYVET